MPRHDSVDNGLGETGVADVADMRRRLADQAQRLLKSRGIAIDQSEMRAFLRKQLRAGAADTRSPLP